MWMSLHPLGRTGPASFATPLARGASAARAHAGEQAKPMRFLPSLAKVIVEIPSGGISMEAPHEQH